MREFPCTSEELEIEIREILAVQTGRNAADIKAESDLVADLDLDSIDFLALVAVLRERYAVKPNVAWIIKRMRGVVLRTFADLTRFVHEILCRAGEGEVG